MSTALKRRLTPEEYLANERIATFKSEFYQGEVFAMAGASEQHNLIVSNCIVSLGTQFKGRPCRVYPRDLRLHIPKTGLFTYPDLMVICGEPHFEFDRRDVVTNPILLVEVLSDSTEAYDRGEKFEQYRTLDSLQQYVLIAQDRFSVESFMKQENGDWLLSATNQIEHMHSLASIQCVLSLADVYDKVEFAMKKDPPADRA